MTVRTSITLDDDLVTKARALTGMAKTSVLVREALKALIERESARQLAAWAGASRRWRQCGAGDPLLP